ncbi:probable basic-leucine zipper transcription factor Q [Scaptodrosophila lebanonensis]|uniref:Probable basic-leucine zipper transcription factor Q n=1 Tax=Drosophila lebanonensis TaxID=7225 RepID=A0A6J2TUK8_DROLE|nr:probable basic-leucine zipper transcription factor Q [Scaptodrosophila lebanonensis]
MASTKLRRDFSSLMVSGRPMQLGDRFVPQLTMRRIYSTKGLQAERYRHEIANHYRDYKMQPQQSIFQRRRRRPMPCRPRQAASLKSQYAQYRGVLPTHVHYFPRFADTYAPRGRQTICTAEPPDETYNDAVRRIRSAQSCEELKVLVEPAGTTTTIRASGQRQRQQQRQRRQSGKRAETTTTKPWRRRGRRERHESDDDNEAANDNSLQLGHGDGSAGSRGSYEHQLLNINTAKVENLQRPTAAHKNNNNSNNNSVQRVDFYTYLQLASAYYEQGLHANIKYLQSIGARNAIRRQQQQKQQQQEEHLQQQQRQHRQRHDSVQYFSFCPWQQHQAVDNFHNGDDYNNSELYLSNTKAHGDLDADAIRVHITPVHRTDIGADVGADASITATITDKIMCDFTWQQGTDTNTNSNNNSSSSSNGNSNGNLTAIKSKTTTNLDQQHKLYEIIDNLSQLSVSDYGCDTQLPKITLTDCTQQAAAALGFSLSLSGNFDIIASKLQIPNEVDYRSEARPP